MVRTLSRHNVQEYLLGVHLEPEENQFDSAARHLQDHTT